MSVTEPDWGHHDDHGTATTYMHIAALERALNAKGRVVRTPHGEEVRIRVEYDAMILDVRTHHTEPWVPVAEAPGFTLRRAGDEGDTP